VGREIWEPLRATGIVKPWSARTRRWRAYAGKVVELLINVGDKVAVGQVIARLSRTISAKVAQDILAESRLR
jgi:multidrug efflux pump subunit AcrA (membrane-fusion protein)